MLIYPGWGERLKEERKRSGENQEVFGQRAGVSRGTQKAYELESSAPDINYISRLEKPPINADVIYILTGNKHAPVGAAVEPAEQELLSKIRGLGEEDRKLVMRLVELAAADPASPSE